MQKFHFSTFIPGFGLRNRNFAFKLAPVGPFDPERVWNNMSEIATALEPELLYETRDGIGRITFNRPQARNSLTFAMYERLAEICESAAKNDSLRVLVLTGAGDKAFAAGTDINQFRAFKAPKDAIDYEARG